MNIPADLRYTKSHEWARADDDVMTIGITDFAQDALGDVVFVKLPEPGTTVARGDVVAEVESTKSVSEIYAPLDGEIAEVNSLVADSPEKINSSCYEDGWICRITPAAGKSLDELLTPEAYADLVADA